METKIKNRGLMPSLHKAGVNSDFYILIDRLQVHSEWKYPNRLWTNDTYYNIAWEWRDKKEDLKNRVEMLEKEMIIGKFTKLIQTRLKTDTQRGNCLATAIGCIMGLNDPEEVLQVQELYHRDDVLWIDELRNWLDEKGWDYYHIEGHLFNNELYLVGGNTVRDILHVCVYQNGKLYHDPHPSQSGLITETSFNSLRPIKRKH